MAAVAGGVRNDLIARALAAGFAVQSIAADPPALTASLRLPGEACVVTGGPADSAWNFVRIAQAAAVPVLAVLEGVGRSARPALCHEPATAVLAVSSSRDAFRAAVAAIRAGLSVWDAEADAVRRPGFASPSLSPRERDVLGRVAAGLTTKVIARQLDVSPNTVKFHLQAAFDKLGVASRAEAVVVAIRRGELAV